MLAGLLLFVGCTEPPVFTGIRAVTVIPQGSGGTTPVELSGEQLASVQECLYQTVEVRNDDLDPDLLQEILLVQVKDQRGDRLFELFTGSNFKGNKKYYKSTCLYRLLKQ